MRTTKLITISILPNLLKKAEKIAKNENRTRSELFREALRMYIEEKEWQDLYRYGRRKAKEQGLTEKDVERLVDEYRSEQADV